MAATQKKCWSHPTHPQHCRKKVWISIDSLCARKKRSEYRSLWKDQIEYDFILSIYLNCNVCIQLRPIDVKCEINNENPFKLKALCNPHGSLLSDGRFVTTMILNFSLTLSILPKASTCSVAMSQLKS